MADRDGSSQAKGRVTGEQGHRRPSPERNKEFELMRMRMHDRLTAPPSGLFDRLTLLGSIGVLPFLL